MSKNSSAFKLVATAISFKCVETPDSPLRPITRLPMPRMPKLEPPKLVAVNATLGALSCKSDGLMICRSARMLSVRAVTAIGTSWTLSSTRCAVTVTSSMPPAAASPSAAAVLRAVIPKQATKHKPTVEPFRSVDAMASLLGFVFAPIIRLGASRGDGAS